MRSASGASDLLRIAVRIERLPAKLQQAAARALATAARDGRSLVSKRIRAIVALPRTYVAKKLYTKRLPGGDWEIGAPRQDGVPLVVYPHQAIGAGRSGRGIRVQESPGDWTAHAHAFRIAQRGGGYQRMTRYGPMLFERAPGAGRYPIVPLRGLSVSDVFEDVRDDVAPEIQAIAARELERQVKLLEKEAT